MPSGLPRNRLIGSSVSEKTSSETVRKGFRIAARASILAPHSSEIGLFRPFRGLLRLQFGARGDFSDSLSETVRKVVRATLRPWIWPVYGVQNGPKSTLSMTRKATLQARPRLFGQSLSAAE